MAVLAWRFFTTGGVEMLRAMARPHDSHGNPGGEMEHHTSAIDPACGMTVNPDKAQYRSVHEGKTYYFCSGGCKESFEKDPGKYVGAGVTRPD
jgi:YHS domain-containing protein